MVVIWYKVELCALSIDFSFFISLPAILTGLESNPSTFFFVGIF